MRDNEATVKTEINRRKLLQGLSIAAAAGVAGCSDDSNGEDHGATDGELGERVPTVNYKYWTGSGGVTQAQEDFLDVIQPNLEEIGIDIEVTGQNASEAISLAVGDTRDHHFMLYNHGATPDRLDPDEFVMRYAADQAGGEGINLQQYVNCEQTDAANLQRTAQTEEERQELVNEAVRIQSEDWASAPLFPYITFNAYRSDLIELGDDVGAAGISRDSYMNLIDVDVLEGDTVVTNVPEMSSSSHLMPGETGLLVKWSQLPYSTLVAYDGDYNMTNVLAESVDISDDAQTITVTLRDHQFSNGREITAEDVKFTFEFINDNVDQNDFQSEMPIDDIEVVDDRTAEFITTEPALSLLSEALPKWGILPREQWEDVENLDDFQPHDTEEGLIGSGPFELVDFQPGQYAEFVPSQYDHPVYDVDHNVVIEVYDDPQPVFQALQSGELNQAAALGANIADQAEGIDNIELSIVDPHTTHSVFPQCQLPPSSLPEFRRAVGIAYDRQRMNELAFGGRSEPLLYSGNSYSPAHPYFDEDQHINYTDNVEGDREEARQVLIDAGFGYDDDGRLHYPPDANLEPQWPEGTTPGAHAPDEFTCLDENNEWVHPDER